jgi:hypothetical protein
VKKLYLSVISLLFVSVIFFFSPKPAQASLFSNIVDGVKNNVKNLLHIDGANTLSLTSFISLAPKGDLNKNGKIDAGDTLRFTYMIKNQKSDTYKFTTLDTNVDTRYLNSIRNLQGVMSVNSSGNTLSFPNISLRPNQQRTISFDATINFYKDKDLTVNTTPELIDANKKSLAKAQNQHVVAAKMTLSAFKLFTHTNNEK